MSASRELAVWIGGLGLLCNVSLGCGAATEPADSAPTLGAPPITAGTAALQPGAAAPATQAPAKTTAVPPGLNTTPAAPAANVPVQGTTTVPPALATAGAPGSAAAAGAAAPATAGTAAPGAHAGLAMDECGIKTKFAGDNYCILPPPADKGFQMHVGPKNYDNVEARYLLQPGEERTDDLGTTSSNTTEKYFYYRQFRQRPGAHHNIITRGGGGDVGLSPRIGTVNVLAEDYPKGGIIAPENKGVGIKMPANSSINVSLHSINTSDKVELREVWVNFWYRDESEVTEPVNEIFAIATPTPIAPGADVVTPGSCTVSGNGRLLWAYGHRHANTVQFTMWRNRGGKKDMFYLSYHWEEVLLLDYSSTVMNPKGDEATKTEGGWSGILDLKSGDQVTWACHVINKQNSTLLFTNNTYTGEMCILDAEMVGANCQ